MKPGAFGSPIVRCHCEACAIASTHLPEVTCECNLVSGASMLWTCRSRHIMADCARSNSSSLIEMPAPPVIQLVPLVGDPRSLPQSDKGKEPPVAPSQNVVFMPRLSFEIAACAQVYGPCATLPCPARAGRRNCSFLHGPEPVGWMHADVLMSAPHSFRQTASWIARAWVHPRFRSLASPPQSRPPL
jgi:hypothetical protein